MLQRLLLLGIIASLGLLTNTTFAQGLDHVQGDILVQMHPMSQARVQDWVEGLTTSTGQRLELTYEEQLSRPMNIHRISFDYTQWDENIVLREIRRHRHVVNAQFNHFVTIRNIPNDPLFNQQWQYINDGSNGGVEGADIDMDLAWDITTGGLTAYGDTIVACVIDDGIDNDHPDIRPNLWVNHAEIPDNGIDDDGNGYIDDYRGWDTGSNSDAVYDGGGHGTPVAGIVGAKGDNGIGVAGVNWNVKLMIVQGGSGVESEVLEAYSYPLEARMRYNETNGEEGAFVVTTNASWGVNFGQPEDSPLWCAFYDTLGVHGIVSCGATANLGIDIDVEGDLPTGCSSDYLISVTNMWRDDEKVNGAGWGLETIDLGAFGQATYTVAAGGNYGGFGGTSGATPHVTGTVALMYALPCTNLMDLAISDPGAAALLIKDAILDGVDPNESLQGITVTGGRLNVNNTANLLLASCGGCVPPVGVEALVQADSAAIISWDLLDTTAQVNIRIRPIGSDDWNQTDSVSSPYLANGLTACTVYEFQLQSECGDTTITDFTNSLLFETDGCCENPSDITLSEVTETSASLTWSSVLAATAYEILFREQGTGPEWDTIITTNLSLAFDNLAACTPYEYSLRTICANQEIGYSPAVSFTTRGCGACLDFEYCDSDELTTDEEFIAAVVINDFSNISEGGDGGYQNFTDQLDPVELITYHTYPVVLSPEFTGQSYDEGWRIWIDYNQDGEFGNDEIAFEGDPSQDAVSGTMTIPSDALEGLTRMRVYMQYNVLPGGACGEQQENFGEVEDYCVNITAGQPCPAITSVMQDSVSLHTDTTALLTWTTEDTPASYTYRYRRAAPLPWVEITEHLSNEVVIEGLLPCTSYEFQVKTFCAETLQTEYTPVMNFMTACISSTRQVVELDRWRISPNPTSDQVILDYAFAQTPDWVQLEIIDQYGRLLRTENITAQNQAVNLSELPAGVYFFRLKTGDGYSNSQRVVKL